ncbi:MAG: NADH:ubiquinone oxidoreductase 24 kD subunit [Paenibacillaceae bacterium]|nr:NADH:ubiquinone oxidoreductase 24 kD subunit [Paenibacillaceae bacterium]
MKQQISICIGSSCHLKGAYRLIEEVRQYVEAHKLIEQVELKANFCVGRCQHAVSVQVDDKPCVQVSEDGIHSFLNEYLKGGA